MAGLYRNLSKQYCFFKNLQQPLFCGATLRQRTVVDKHFTDAYPIIRMNENMVCQNSRRNFHSTASLLKKHKFDASLYEKVYIVDISGSLITHCEFLVLKKFCTRFNRFSFELLESGDAREVATKHNLKEMSPFYQLKEKSTLDGMDMEKYKKIVKMNLKASLVPFQVKKLLEELVNHGSVTLKYRDGPAFDELSEIVSRFGQISVLQMGEGRKETTATIQMKSLTTSHFEELFSEISASEEAHIQSVKDMLKVEEPDSTS